MTPTLRTFSGKTVDMLAPRPEDIELADIARGLATQVRFCGHINRYHYSVAEHSVLVSRLLRDAGHDLTTQRAGLLHDAAEAYLGDLIGPVKTALRVLEGNPTSAFDALESRWLIAIGTRFGVELEPISPTVKQADLLLLQIEDRDLRGISHGRRIDAPPLRCLIPVRADELFTAAYEELGLA